MTNPENDPLQRYREHCVSAGQKVQEDYDKAVLTLSGGALGVSFAFIKDVIGPGAITHPRLLLGAWIVWGMSVVITLASYWFSGRALRKAINQIDAGNIHGKVPGGAYAGITESLNAVGGLLFVTGVILMVFFVSANVDQVHRSGSPRGSESGTAARVDRVISIGPFAAGDTVPASREWNGVDSAISTAVKSFRARGQADAILLLGSVDRRPLSRRAALRFGSNLGLATARAEAVRARVLSRVGDSVAVYVVPTGALELARGLGEADFGQDRRVDLYVLSRASTRESK